MIASLRSLSHRAVPAIAIGSVFALASCSFGGGDNRAPQDTEEAAVQGDASPASSPKAADPAGKVIDAPKGMQELDDVESTAGTLAVRSADKLAVGSLADFANGQAEIVPLDAKCGDITTAEDAFLAPCGDEVLLISATQLGEVSHIKIDEEFPVTAAAVTGSGELFVTSQTDERIAVYKDGERIDEIRAEPGSDQLLAVGNPGTADGVVRVKRKDTTIQSLDWENSRAGGRLRVGQGLGEAATSRDGVIVVSDTVGKRVAIYTDDDVVRLHQFGLTDGTPWAVSWDPERKVAWATTTDNNQAQAFDISTGVPKSRGTFATVANAQSMTVLDDGTVVLASASGDGLQAVSDPKLDDK